MGFSFSFTSDTVLTLQFSICSICSVVTSPGLYIIGSPDKSITVDSIPTLQSPPSIIASTLPFISSTQCANAVGLGLPDKFALGAAIGTPESSKSLFASDCTGILTPTVSSPAVTSFLILLLFFKIIVSGPGQNLSISFLADSGTSLTISFNCLTS